MTWAIIYEWGRKKSRVVFEVPTSKNNVFALLKQALHSYIITVHR
jgi:hypothetical protein